MKEKTTALPIITGILAAAIFGMSFMFSSVALRIVDVFTLLSFRFLLAFAAMSLLVLTRLIKVRYQGKNLSLLVLIALLQPIAYFICETFGIRFSSSSFAGMIIALIPISIAVASVFFLKEKPTVLQWVFISLSVAGVLLIVLMGGGEVSTSLSGTVFLLLAVLCATAFNLISRKISVVFSPFEITYFMMGVGALVFTCVSLVRHAAAGTLSTFFHPFSDIRFIASWLYLGLLSSVVAFLSLNYTLSKIEASRSSVFGNLCTIVSIVAGVVFLHEHIAYYHIIGAVCIVAGVWGMQAVKKPSPAPTVSSDLPA